MRRSSSPIRKSPRCAIPTASSACWIPRPCGPRRASAIDKHLLLTRYDPARAARGEMLKIEDVLEILSIPLLGIIPESEEVLRASNLGAPVTLSSPAQRAGPRLFRRGEAAARRDGRDHHAGRERTGSSASCSDGGRHEPVRLVPPAQFGAGGARAAADPARARARAGRPAPIWSRCCARRSSR